MKNHLFTLVLSMLFCLPLLGQNGSTGIYVEAEGQDPGFSNFWIISHRPSPESRFGFGGIVRYLEEPQYKRLELSATGSIYWGQKHMQFCSASFGMTTQEQWYSPAICSGKIWKLSATAIVDPKYDNGKLSTTVYTKGLIGIHPLFYRSDNFVVAGNVVSSIQGLELRQNLPFSDKLTVQLFVAGQVNLIGPVKPVVQGGIRFGFKL